MKYIGPFLRLNSLNEENIENQLFHLSKESFRHIIFNSKCGIIVNTKEAKSKDLIGDLDSNILKNHHPILCMYKRGNPKLKNTNNKFYWDDGKIKKDIDIFTNSCMTLTLLELADYYKDFKNIDKHKYSLCTIYNNLAKKQLHFYATYLRNDEGVFVDKVDTTDSDSMDFKFEIKNSKFKFSNQGFIMCAFYKYSLNDVSKNSDMYKNFALDILNMFIDYKEDLTSLSFDELLKTTLSMNIFYKYSKNKDARVLLLHLFEILNDKYCNCVSTLNKPKFESLCLYNINALMLYRNTDFLIYKDLFNSLSEELIKFYNSDYGIFVKTGDGKPFDYSPTDVYLYINFLLLNCFQNIESKKDFLPMLTSTFKNQLVNSGLILTWPSAPNLDDRERYKGFSLDSKDLLDEKDFKLSTIPSPENLEFAPVFIKEIKYNEKKHTFKQGKSYFYSAKNMPIFFMEIFLHNMIYKNK